MILEIHLDAKTYPSDKPPAFIVRGFWQDKAYTITCRLNERFVPGCPVLYDWYSMVKDELFAEANGELDKIFFPNGSLLELSKQSFELLQEELRWSYILNAKVNGLDCSVCFTNITNEENLHIFKNCLHAFCKDCIK